MLNNNATYQRETLSERPIQQPLSPQVLTVDLDQYAGSELPLNSSISPYWSEAIRISILSKKAHLKKKGPITTKLPGFQIRCVSKSPSSR